MAGQSAAPLSPVRCGFFTLLCLIEQVVSEI